MCIVKRLVHCMLSFLSPSEDFRLSSLVLHGLTCHACPRCVCCVLRTCSTAREYSMGEYCQGHFWFIICLILIQFSVIVCPKYFLSFSRFYHWLPQLDLPPIQQHSLITCALGFWLLSISSVFGVAYSWALTSLGHLSNYQSSGISKLLCLWSNGAKVWWFVPWSRFLETIVLTEH